MHIVCDKLRVAGGRACTPPSRRGLIFYVTLIVVLMTGLLAAGLNFYVRSQLAGEFADRHSAQATEAARAGVAMAAALLLDPEHQAVDLSDNPEWFQEMEVVAGPPDWHVSLMRDMPEDDEVPAYGLTDESGKLNLNVATVEQLLVLPEMTPEIAQAIIDWRDRDDRPGDLGAENEYYQNLDTPYSVKNAPFESVDELLLVRGVTELLLYGEDLNRNGLLEPNENDGDKRLPPDNSDGKLDVGWYAYLTVYSIEHNRTRDGRRRLNISSTSPTSLYDQMIERGFSDSLAEFLRDARKGGAKFKHPADLLGWEGKVKDSKGKQVEMRSALTPEELPLVLEELTASSRGLSLGLVNPAAASGPVLEAVGFESGEAEAAVSARGNLDPEETLTCAWLVREGVLSVERFRELAGRLCGRGRQFRIDAVGYSKQLGLFRRIETVIDVGRGWPRTMYCRDLTGLGPVYVLDSAKGEGPLRLER